MRLKKLFVFFLALALAVVSFSFTTIAVSADLIEVNEDSELVIDRSDGYVTGIVPGTTFADIADDFVNDVHFCDYYGNDVDMQAPVTTNSAVYTTDFSDILIFLIYGDVNGDGAVDGNDASLIEMLISGQIEINEIEKSNYDAAVYADRVDGLTNSDVRACFESGLMSKEIPQFSKPDVIEDESEMLEQFNSIINSVKATRPGVKTVRVFEIPNVSGEGYISQQIADSIKGKEETTEEVFEKGKSHDDAIPIAKKTWSSSLTIEDIKDITCTDNGDGTFSLTAYMPDESYDALTVKVSDTVHGKIIDACQFVPESGQEGWYTSVTASYSGVYVECRYNAYTNQFIRASYHIPYQVHMLGSLKIGTLLSYPIDVLVEYIQTIEVEVI